jgi:hypothetical protein
MYRRSCWASQTWFNRNLSIGLSPAHAEARADDLRFQVVAGSFTHSKVSAKINRKPPGSVPARLPIATDGPAAASGQPAEVVSATSGRCRVEAKPSCHRVHNWSPEFIEGRRQLVSLLHDYTQDLAGIQAPVLLIRTVAAIIPSGAVRGRPCRSAARMISL